MTTLSMRCIRAILFTLAAIVVLVTVKPVSAQGDDTPVVDLEASAGFDGFYKGEFWVPVHIKVANNGAPIDGAVEITVGESISGGEVVYRSHLNLPTQSNKQLSLYVYFPGFTNELNVQLVDNNGRTIATTTTNTLNRLSADDLLYGIVSSEPDELEDVEKATGRRPEAAAAFLEIHQLPEIASAWNALDVIYFHDIDSSKLSTEQLEALMGWVETGGQLVVVGGPAWQKPMSGLADLLPVEVMGLKEISDLPTLENFAGIDFRDPGPYLVNDSTLHNGELLIHQDGLPLLARRTMGRGAVFFLALDPNLAPLADWDGSEVLWSTIAFLAPRLPTWGRGAMNSYNASTAVSSLPSVALPSALLLFAFLFFYVLAVGPVNYLVLKRMGRRELAWVTVPILVLLFSSIAYLTGFRLKGNDIIINEMSIAYGSTDGEQLRVQSLIGLYSPRRGTYDVSLPGNSVARPFNQGFGNMAGAGNLEAVDQDLELKLSAVRVDVSGVETFVADSYQLAPSIIGQAVLHMEDSDFSVETRIQNNGDFALENAVLIIGNAAVPIGDIPPGANDTSKHPITGGQISAVTGSVGSSLVMAAGPGNSPISRNYETLLGTSNYFDDPEAFPRWQLLQAISPEYGVGPYYVPRATATLVGWSRESQVSAKIENQDVVSQSTTLYFLELPLSNTTVSGQGVTVPKPLLEWQVLAQSGIYNPTINDLYLTTGWVEFEYEPWPELQNLAVTDLEISIEKGGMIGGQPAPFVQLWDWRDGAWVTIRDIQWGLTPIEQAAFFIGPQNAVRIRVQNNTNDVIEISEIYPLITGDVK